MSSYGYPPYLRPPKSRSKKLLEGAGCLGILAFLTAVVWPVFTSNSPRPEATVCLSNVKQSSLGLLMYSQDFDERMPAGNRWMSATWPYIKNESVYRCPKVQKEDRAAYGIAFHSILSGQSLEYPVAPGKTGVIEIEDPATLPMLFDSHLLNKNATSTIRVGLAAPGRHLEGNTIGFLDGHAKWIRDRDAGRLRTTLR